MAEIEHIQYDEFPFRRFRLPYEIDGVPVAQADWPPLNADDKVTMVLRQGVTDRAVKLFIIDPAARLVEWRPGAPENSAAVSSDFRIRVTQADGKSYSHPGPGVAPWKLIVKAATATTDVADPA